MLSLLDRPSGNVGVELGVAGGDFSVQLLESGRFGRLYGVDAYADHHDVDEYKSALRRVGLNERYALLRMRFEEALDMFDDESLDFVHIDGYAHTGQEGGETIYAWASKVKLGGVLSGHDYDPAFPLTIAAVDRFAHDAGFDVHVADGDADYASWAVVKTGATSAGTAPDKLRQEGRRRARIAAIRSALARPVKRLLRGGAG